MSKKNNNQIDRSSTVPKMSKLPSKNPSANIPKMQKIPISKSKDKNKK